MEADASGGWHGMKYQVTDYVIDTALYRISRAGDAIPVEPKVFDLLVYLIRHRDRVLARDELFQEVWNGREVSDGTLSNHIKSARKVLGDSGELQKTILTIRGRGYQFVAPVTEIPAGARKPAEDEAPAAPAVRAIRKPAAPAWRLPLGLGALLLAAVLIGWRVLAPHAPPKADLPYVVVVPFDVSGDAPEVWQPFADQVTREVIRNLRKISGLRVVPTPSAFTFRDNKSTEHIRRQLPDVQYVLDGVVSVAADNSLRIIAELEDLNQGRLVWDKDFEGRIDDTNFFAMQSGIAAAVSASLKVVILKDEQRALSELPTTNLKAYECTWRDVRRWSCSVMSPCLAPLISSARPSRWTRNSSPRISPEAMPTARCLPTSSRRSKCCQRWFLRSPRRWSCAPIPPRRSLRSA